MSAEIEVPRQALAEPWCFGPAFFLAQIAGFVREECPADDESLPQVELHLATGETLDLCHVVGVTPTWVALAVFAGRTGEHSTMRTELVPYALITHVTVRQGARAGGAMGFDVTRTPRVLPAGAIDLGSAAGVQAALRGAPRIRVDADPGRAAADRESRRLGCRDAGDRARAGGGEARVDLARP